MSTSSHDPQWLDLSKKLFKFLVKRSGGDVEASSEAVQNTYLAATRSYHTFGHKSTYFTWVCRIALNKLADYYRDQINSRSKTVIPTIEAFNSFFDPHLTPEEKLSLDELAGAVNQCLNSLPAKYRQLLQFKYYEQLSSTDICLKLNLTPRKLEGRLYRARKALATAFAKAFPHLKP